MNFLPYLCFIKQPEVNNLTKPKIMEITIAGTSISVIDFNEHDAVETIYELYLAGQEMTASSELNDSIFDLGKFNSIEFEDQEPEDIRLEIEKCFSYNWDDLHNASEAYDEEELKAFVQRAFDLSGDIRGAIDCYQGKYEHFDVFVKETAEVCFDFRFLESGYFDYDKLGEDLKHDYSELEGGFIFADH